MSADKNTPSPDMVKAAIEQAERETAERAKEQDDLARVAGDCMVAGKPAAALSYARRLILGKLYNAGVIDGDEEGLMAAVFVLFGGTAADLARLARKPAAFVDRAAEFADATPAADYEQMAAHAARKVAELSAVADMSDEGDEPGGAGGGPEGNAHA